MNPHLRATFRDIFDGVRSQPTRVGLSFAALAVGIIALTVLVAVLGGLDARSRAMIREFGANVFAVVPPAPGEGAEPGPPALRRRHAALLAANLPGCLVSGILRDDVALRGAEKQVTVIRCDETLAAPRPWGTRAGRFFDAQDVLRGERCAVVSLAASRQWNWNVGDVMDLRTAPFRILGIVESGGGVLQAEGAAAGVVLGERVVFVPRSVPGAMLSIWEPDEPGLDAVFIRVPEAQPLEAAVARARRVLEQPLDGAAGLSWITPDVLLERVRKLQSTIRLTAGSIAVLCLILGGTTLMSLMVANVRDRVTEIGLRRALGARPADIALLFVLEASLVTLAAGLAGTLLTHLVLLLGRSRFPVPLSLGPVSLLLPLGTAVVLGAVFSYWPARAAAAITPAAALRND